MNSHHTIAQITAILAQLTEGDRQRVLKFVAAIAQSRQEKRQKRRSRFKAESVDSWQIGE